MKLEFGTNTTWREVGLRIALNRWYNNEFFIELNLWKWFVTFEIKLKSKEMIDND